MRKIMEHLSKYISKKKKSVEKFKNFQNNDIIKNKSMNSVPNRDFMELHTVHQHQSHCKQHFVFTDIADIDLPPEITKYPDKMNNGSIHSYKKENIPPPSKPSKSKKIIAIAR